MTNVRKFLKENGGYVFVLTLVGMFLYAFNLHNTLFWDDADWILNNPAVHAFTWANIKFIFSHDVLAGIGLVSNYYRPFLFLTFLANYVISKSSPTSYHLLSNIIHVGNGILIFYLLSRWLKSKRAAFLGAVLFVIHPLQTEAVAYISGRGDPLSVFCMLAGIALYINRRPWFAAGLMVLGVLSRETAVLFPAYLGVALIAFEYRGAFWFRLKKALMAVWPYLGIAVIYGVLRLSVLNFQNTLNFYQHSNLYSEHLSYRIYTFLHVLLVYIRLAFLPMGLHMERDLPVSTTIWSGYSWLGALVILAAAGWLWHTYRSRNTEVFNVWFFGLGIFFLNLGPTSGITPINARIYEHWLYFSLFGLVTIFGWYGDRILTYVENKYSAIKPALIIALVAYCLFLSIQTIRRNIIWGDTEAFYQDILSYEPENVRVLNNLGNWYSDHGNNHDAADLYRRAIEADPSQPAPYYNLGNIARDEGDATTAEEFYKKAIDVDSGFHYAYQNLAALYLNEHKLPEAIAVLERLYVISPSLELNTTIQALKRSLGTQ